MNLMGRIESANNDYVFYKDEIYKPRLCIQNGLGTRVSGKYTVYMILPSGQKVFLFTDKAVKVNGNDTKEILLFANGLKVTRQYPSGEYYIVAEVTDLSHPKFNKVYDAFPFHIESRSIFPSGRSFYNISGKNAMPIHHLFGYGHYSAFSNLAGTCPNHTEFRTQLRLLKSYGVNFIRQFMLDGPGTEGDGGSINTIYPWKKTGNKWDLNQPNPDYYQRLDLFMQVCQGEGVFFQADMTDHYTMYKSQIWPTMPMYPDNNHQNSFGFPRKNTAFPEWYSIHQNYPQFWNAIRDYIDRVCEVMSKYDYSMYLIMNEAVDGSDQDVFLYHQAFAKRIKEKHPNAIIAANVQHYNPHVEGMVYNLKEIEVMEAHGCAGITGNPPFGEYRGDYFWQFDTLMIPDEDGCWESRSPQNSILRMDKLIQASGGRLYGIWKAPWPNNQGFNDWIPFLQHAKDCMGI